MNFGSDECTEISLVLSQAVLKHVAIVPKHFIFKNALKYHWCESLLSQALKHV